MGGQEKMVYQPQYGISYAHLFAGEEIQGIVLNRRLKRKRAFNSKSLEAQIFFRVGFFRVWSSKEPIGKFIEYLDSLPSQTITLI
jgi:hypothetical protein